MADIQKWCLGQMKEAQAALESALRQADEEGLRMELRHALEIYGRLEEELVQLKLGTVETEQLRLRDSARIVCDGCAERARNYAALLTRLPAKESELCGLLKKLIAAEDQTVVRLRSYL